MNKSWNKEGVSPVIAHILLVAITVVLAAVLYVMVIGMSGDSGISTPLGLNQQSKSVNNVTLLIASAPNGAKIYGSQISMTSGGTPTPITTAYVYNLAAVLQATYMGGIWTFSGGATQDSAEYTAGMTIVINVAAGVSNGDVITIASDEQYFGTTTLTLN